MLAKLILLWLRILTSFSTDWPNDDPWIHLPWMVNGFQEVEWRNNPLANCHNMDTLWGFMIRAGEQCCMSVPADLRDPVLWRLLKVWNLTETTLDTVYLTSQIDGDLRLEGT